MFKKLKLKFILTNVLTSTAVLFIAFASVYLVAAGEASRRENKPFNQFSINVQPGLEDNPSTNGSQDSSSQTRAQDQMLTVDVFNQEMANRIHDERNASLQTLLVSLVVSGLVVEAIIVLISFYLAEQAIKPVREAYQAQKDFVANASHEIKTPLAVIQANLEAADIHGNKWLDNVARKTEDLANLNNQLLALARSESVTDDIKLSEVSLEKLLDNTLSAFGPKAAEQGITLRKSSEIKNPAKVKINRQAFEQILNIYTDNAIKYGKKLVILDLQKNSVRVFSDGKAMDKKKIPQLFNRFYQSDKNSDGVGLGLAIAKSVADKNGWKLSVYVDEKSKHNVFVLEFK